MTPNQGLYGAPIGAGWQTILADLSLILFMMTAAALASSAAAKRYNCPLAL